MVGLSCRRRAFFYRNFGQLGVNNRRLDECGIKLFFSLEIIGQFSGQKLKPDLIIDSGKIPTVPPSKVIDLTNKGKVLRKG